MLFIAYVTKCCLCSGLHFTSRALVKEFGTVAEISSVEEEGLYLGKIEDRQNFIQLNSVPKVMACFQNMNSFSMCLSKVCVGSIGCSANIYAVFHYLSLSFNSVSSDRYNGFPESLFQVSNIVNVKI